MPVVSPGNNRVLPPNARSGDVARETLHAIMPVQARKTDQAFQVDGYTGVLYSYLTSGQPCACQAKGKALNTRLDKDGKASPGAISEMMSSSGNFGMRPYGEKVTVTPAYAQERARGHSVLEINLASYGQPAVPVASLFDESDIEDMDVGDRDPKGLPDRVGYDAENTTLSTIVEHDLSTDVNEYTSDFDQALLGHSDINCPICFGSGFIGGFNLLHGYRKIFTFQDTSMVLPATAFIGMELDIPTITTTEVSWTFVLPFGVVNVDAFRLWDETEPVTEFVAKVDTTHTLTSEFDLYQFCDGKPHTLSLQFNQETTFTHLELQVNQSTFSANFALPKTGKGSNRAVLESMDPFTVFLSPLVPAVKPLDVIVESTYGKVLHVKTTTGQNDHHLTTLGWEVDVRPTQPQELLNMLPHRKPRENQNVRRRVIGNPNTN